MSEEDAPICPSCGSSSYGCTVLEVGAFCRGPRRLPPPPPSRPAAARARVTLAELASMLGQDSELARRKLLAHACVMWGASVRRMLGLPPLGVLLFGAVLGAPVGRCGRCGSDVAWVSLPTGGRLAVDPATSEAHDATCPAG